MGEASCISRLAISTATCTVLARVKRSPLVQKVLYRPLAGDRPEMTPDERAHVHEALGSEVAELDRLFGLDLAQRWGWQSAAPSTDAGGPTR